jgi:hypothetical protein
MAVHQAEAGRADWGQAHARAAVELFEEVQDPRAGVFAEHLRRFSAGGSIPAAAGLAPPWGETLVVHAGAGGAATGLESAKGPGLLKMALTAAAAAARHTRSGFRTVPEADLRTRLDTCAACEYHTGLRCRLCGCFTGVKARMPHEKCPAGKW